jgi:hypothetical protein
MPPEWLYCLTDEQGRSYYVDNGIVQQPVSTPTPLPVTPDGWQDKTIKYGRNTRYWSLFRTFTTPLKYVKQAALIVRDRWIRSGSEDRLYQVIHRLDKSFGGGWKHKFFYKGELDLSKVKDSDTNIAVNIMEGGLSKYINANENTEYEIDMNVPEAVVVQMDGKEFQYSASFLTTDKDYSLQRSVASNRQWLITFVKSSVEGTTLNLVTNDIIAVTDNSINFATDERYFMSAETALSMLTTFNFKGFLKKTFGNSSVDYKLRLINQAGTVVQTFIDENRSGMSAVNEAFSLSPSVTLSLNEGDKLFMVLNVNVSSTDNSQVGTLQLSETISSFTYLSKYRTTYIKGLRPVYVAQKLLDKMTGGGYTFTSTYLSTEWENLLLTSGDAIRGFTDAKLKISWADFFDSYNVPCNLSSGIRNQVLYVEKKENAFQATIQQALGRVSKMEPESATEFQYNVVKIGYPDTNTEDVNGRDEFNVTVVYTSPITRTNKVLDLVSKVIASMYEIELTRINLDGKTTTDDENDSRAFFLHVEKTATAGTGDEPATYYKLLRPVYDSVTDLISPATAFNMELHPELCLRRHGNFLRSLFYWQDAGYLVRETSKKNDKVTVIKAGQTYIGNKTIRIGTLDPALFIPITFKVEGPMPMTIIDTMDAGPDGTFSFVYGNDTYYGYPMEVGIQPANRPAQETTLLCSPQTTITQLITMKR